MKRILIMIGLGVCAKGCRNVVHAPSFLRPGDLYEVEQDAVSVIGQKNVIIDHCSFSWGNDEVLSAYNNENISVQWCIISESLNESHHHKGEHGYGRIGILDSQDEVGLGPFCNSTLP